MLLSLCARHVIIPPFLTSHTVRVCERKSEMKGRGWERERCAPLQASHSDKQHRRWRRRLIAMSHRRRAALHLMWNAPTGSAAHLCLSSANWFGAACRQNACRSASSASRRCAVSVPRSNLMRSGCCDWRRCLPWWVKLFYWGMADLLSWKSNMGIVVQWNELLKCNPLVCLDSSFFCL